MKLQGNSARFTIVSHENSVREQHRTPYLLPLLHPWPSELNGSWPMWGFSRGFNDRCPSQGAFLPLLSAAGISPLRNGTLYLEGLAGLRVAGWGLVALTGDTCRFSSTRASRSTKCPEFCSCCRDITRVPRDLGMWHGAEE